VVAHCPDSYAMFFTQFFVGITMLCQQYNVLTARRCSARNTVFYFTSKTDHTSSFTRCKEACSSVFLVFLVQCHALLAACTALLAHARYAATHHVLLVVAVAMYCCACHASCSIVSVSVVLLYVAAVDTSACCLHTRLWHCFNAYLLHRCGS
jgi:hypothetical protein